MRAAPAVAIAALLVLVALSVQLSNSTTPRTGVLATDPTSDGTSAFEQAVVSLERGSGPAYGHPAACSEDGSGLLRCSADSLALARPEVQSPHWTNLTGPVAPPRSAFVSMTYDVADQYVVLFGGLDASAFPTNDTWVFSNGAWTNITATAGAAPAPRYDMAMTYDAADGYVLAFGGSSLVACGPTSSSTICNDTWTFAHGKWDRLDIAPPPGYTYPVGQMFSMTYDAADSYVLATTGTDTWRYAAGVWSAFCGTNCTNFIPAPGGVGTVAYDSGDGYVVYVGAALVADQLPSDQKESYTWKFSGGTWTNITATAGTPPPQREYAALVADSGTGGLLLFGGWSTNATDDFVYLNDTWAFGGGAWSRVSTASSPTGVYGAGAADDTGGSWIVLFGGESGNGNAWNLNDTWIWGASPPIGELEVSVNPSVPVPGANATFSVSFAGGVAPFSYNWSFGDGGSSTVASPTHSYRSDGYYNVQVWVNDSAGHSVSTALRVHAYTPLSVTTIQASPDPALLGEVVNFTASATGGTPPYTFSWAFGDGGLGGNLSAITHIYATNGPFEAEVTVSDAAGGVEHGFVNVTIRLQALAGSTSTSGTSPLTVSFVGQAQGGVPPYRFDWFFGDGFTSTLQDPRHTYNSSGTFYVVLRVTDSKNNASNSSLAIEVAGPSSSGLPALEWFYAFIAALAGVVCVAAVWSATILRRRGQRREGEQWIEELTAGEESQMEKAPPDPR